jgi:hypothetical protein
LNSKDSSAFGTTLKSDQAQLGLTKSATRSDSRAAVFLVSQDFVNSPFINEKELPALIEAATGRGCLIFWIAVSSSTFEATPLAKYQAASSTPLDLMSEAEQNKVLADISRKLKAAISH